MSLINQMLQELDARRSDMPAADAYGQQVRAIPEKRRVHAAWWIALVLAVILLAVVVLGYFHLMAGRTPLPVPSSRTITPALASPAVPVQPSHEIPLKLATDLSTSTATAQQDISGHQAANAPIPVRTAEPAVEGSAAKQEAAPSTLTAAAPTEPTRLAVFPVMSSSVNEPATQAQKSRPVAAANKKDVMPAATPTNAEGDTTLLAQEREVDSMPTKKQSRTAAPPNNINKQITELTLQQRAENEYRKATVLIQQGRFEEATTRLAQALELDPGHAAARQTLVGVLLNSKRIDEAVQVARQGIAVDPAQPGLAMILARLQLEKGELRASIETLQGTLTHAEGRADYHAFLAALLQRDAQHKEASEHYLQALQKAPHNGTWWLGLGISLQAENRTADAREAYQRAKATNSLTPELVQFVDGRLKQLSR